MRNTFTSHMKTVGQRDQQLVVLIGDISHFALQPFAEACPGRFYNVGILEPTIIGMAAGLAHTGLHPVVHTIAPFMVERGLEQIKLDFCYQELGGNFISVGSAFDYSGLGCSHYCYNDFSIMKALPRTQIVYPSSSIEFEALFDQAYDNEFVTYYRLPNTKHTVEFKRDEIRLGKGIIVKDGADITFVVTGPQLQNALTAAEQLEKNNIKVEVIYIHTPKPFDADLVKKSVLKTKRVIAIEEHSVHGGIGDEVLRCLAGKAYEYQSISIANEFCHGYGSYEDHCKYFGLTADNIINTAKEMF